MPSIQDGFIMSAGKSFPLQYLLLYMALEWCCTLEFHVVLKDLGWLTELIPYMWQAILTNVLVRGRIVDPNEDQFIDGSSTFVAMLSYYGEVFH